MEGTHGAFQKRTGVYYCVQAKIPHITLEGLGTEKLFVGMARNDEGGLHVTTLKNL